MRSPRKQSRSNELTKLINLTREEMASLPKPREGFADHAGALFALYAAHEDELSIKGQTPKDAMARLHAYQTLLDLERVTWALFSRIQDTRALRAGEVWTTMLDVYARARAAGRNDAEMKRAISDFKRFMKHKPRTSKPA